MKNNQESNKFGGDVISLKDIILLVKEYLNEIISKWWVILLICIPTCGYMAYKAVIAEWEYSAEVRFVLEGSGGTSIGGLGGLLGGLGLGGSKGGLNPYKVIEVAKSRVIVEKILMDSSSYSNDIIANEIIEFYDLDNKWSEKNEDYEDFRFTQTNSEKFSEIDRSVYKRLVKVLIGTAVNRENTLIRISQDKNSGIFSIAGKSHEDELILDVTIKMYDHLKDFFENNAVSDLESTKEVLELKRDSLANALEFKNRKLALMRNSSRGTIGELANAEQRNLSNEINGTAIAYQEVYKNYEVADFNLRNTRPSFLFIDRPFMPLLGTKPVLLINLIIGAILGMFLGIVLIVVRKIYKNALEY